MSMLGCELPPGRASVIIGTCNVMFRPLENLEAAQRLKMKLPSRHPCGQLERPGMESAVPTAAVLGSGSSRRPNSARERFDGVDCGLMGKWPRPMAYGAP
eukprot:1257864-Prymnesium_polylepis.1